MGRMNRVQRSVLFILSIECTHSQEREKENRANKSVYCIKDPISHVTRRRADISAWSDTMPHSSQNHLLAIHNISYGGKHTHCFIGVPR